MRNLTYIIIVTLLLSSLLLLLYKHFPEAMHNDQNKISLVILLTVIISMTSRIIRSNIKFAVLLRQITGWLAIAILALTGYSYQYELKQFGNRLSATLIPGYGQGNGDGSVTFYASEGGHFTITALLNDVERINFLFDTGASTVALTQDDAEKIGIDLSKLVFNFPLNTANGTSWAARVIIDKIQVGPIIINNVEATVSKDGLDTSLLGMSFLRQLKQFDIKGNTLTLVN